MKCSYSLDIVALLLRITPAMEQQIGGVLLGTILQLNGFAAIGTTDWKTPWFSCVFLFQYDVSTKRNDDLPVVL